MYYLKPIKIRLRDCVRAKICNLRLPKGNLSLMGFTILESLIAVVIASIVVLGAYTLFLNQQSSNIIQQRKAQLQRNLRLAMDIMVQDIRKAGYDPEDSGFFGISPDSSDSEIRYTIDEDDDGVVDVRETVDVDGDGKLDDGEEHRFVLDGTTLKYTKDANVGMDDSDFSSFTWHAVNVSPVEFTSLQFTDPDGTPPDVSSDKVEITLDGQIILPLKSGGYETQTLSADVILRNKI